jgi:hypothetical protein
MEPWQADAVRELMRVATQAIAGHEERLRVGGWPPFTAFTQRHKASYRAAVNEELARRLAEVAHSPS